MSDQDLIEINTYDSIMILYYQYNHATKKKRQLIDDLATVYDKLLEWTPLLQAEETLPYRPKHTTKYVRGLSQKGANISMLCNRPEQQRYIGQWFIYKAKIMKGKKYIKYVKLSESAKFFFENLYEEAKKTVIHKHGRKHLKQV